MLRKIFFFCALFVLSAGAILAQSVDTVFIKKNKNFGEQPIDYQIDTLVLNSHAANHILVGTTVLPGTWNHINQMNNGVSLREVKITDCEMKNEEGYFDDYIFSIFQTDSVLFVELKISENCCHSFLCDADFIEKDGYLNLIFHGYGDYCSCYCCFGLTYKFDKWNKKIANLKGIMINGNPKTLKKI